MVEPGRERCEVTPLQFITYSLWMVEAAFSGVIPSEAITNYMRNIKKKTEELEARHAAALEKLAREGCCAYPKEDP